MENREVALILRETAQLLEIDGAIIGRYRSYEKVADLLFSLHERIEDIAKDVKKLRELPGIGENMAEHICEILETGNYKLRQKLLKKYPPTLLELLALQSLGPKKVAFLWSNFKCATVADLEKLAREGKLRDLPGFGEKSEQNILKATESAKRSSGRFLVDAGDRASPSSSNKPVTQLSRSQQQAHSAAAAKPSATSICSSRCAPGRIARRISMP
jgi:DNA polymerase (family 10)